jgi:hypothetical protein
MWGNILTHIGVHHTKCHYSMWCVLPLTWIASLLRFEDPVLTSSQILHQRLAI